ncbi:MAG: GNAT family N-acetyltransferase [Candidatus Nanoarchaeia archaeon]
MKIRKATKKDFVIIANLMNKEYSKEPYNEKWKKNNAIKTLNYFASLGEIFVLINDAKTIIGFISYREEYYNEGKSVMIEELIVDSAFQGKGYGRMLVEYIENLSRKKGVKRILLMTSLDAPAFKFYEKIGYIPSKKTVLFRKELK